MVVAALENNKMNRREFCRRETEKQESFSQTAVGRDRLLPLNTLIPRGKGRPETFNRRRNHDDKREGAVCQRRRRRRV